MSSQDAKLDLLIAEMSKLSTQTSEIALLVNRVNVLETTVASQKSTIEALTADVRSLKDIVNHHEQQSRAS